MCVCVCVHERANPVSVNNNVFSIIFGINKYFFL